MPGYWFTSCKEGVLPSLEKLAEEHKLQRVSLADGSIFLWRGHVGTEAWNSSDVDVVYNPKSKFPVRITSPGSYYYRAIPALNEFILKYSRVCAPEKVTGIGGDFEYPDLCVDTRPAIY